jgi:hypothetical protein
VDTRVRHPAVSASEALLRNICVTWVALPQQVFVRPAVTERVVAPNPHTALRIAARMANASRASHPALAPILAAGREDARTVWFRRQDPGGLGLGQLSHLGALEPRAVIAAVTSALEAVAALHKVGVVHGALDADAIRVLNDGRVMLVAPPPTVHRGSGKKADLRALGEVLRALAGSEAGPVGGALAEGQLDDAQTAAWALKGSTGPFVSATIERPKRAKRSAPAAQRSRMPKPELPAPAMLIAAAAPLFNSSSRAVSATTERLKSARVKPGPPAWQRVRIPKPELPARGILAASATSLLHSTGRVVEAPIERLKRAKWTPPPRPRIRIPKPELPARALVTAAAALLLGFLVVATPVANLPARLSGLALPQLSTGNPSGRAQSSTTARPAPLPRTASSPAVAIPVPSPEQPTPAEQSAPLPPPAVAATPITVPAQVAVPVAPQVARAPTDSGPPAAVARFYALVSAHDFADASQMWSPSMQSRYPPQTYIYQRFAGTTSIRATQDALVSESGDGATVAVTVVETTTSGSRTWVGSWQLVKLNGVWLLDQPNLRAA